MAALKKLNNAYRLTPKDDWRDRILLRGKTLFHRFANFSSGLKSLGMATIYTYAVLGK